TKNDSGLEIIPLGGFSEVGRNCVAVKAGDEVFILDMGLAIDKYIEFTEKAAYDQVKVSGKKLIDIGAAPDVDLLGPLKKKVKAILLSHAHLDHVLAVPHLANRFRAPLYATPFTAEIVRTITEGERMPLHEKLYERKAGDRWKLTPNVDAEFVHMTHSTPHTVAIVLHTPYGKVIFAPDFKFDEHPTKGKKSDEKRLKELQGADVLIMDSLYAHKAEKVPSENYARSMLYNVLTKENTEGKIVVATTFASHIFRLQTFLELAKKLNRRPIFLGRSLYKYVTAAEKLEIADFREAEVVPYGSKVRSVLSKIKDPEKCLFVSTGNQGEPKAALYKIIHGNWLPFEQHDLVVFSCITIPVEPNITYRDQLESLIVEKGMQVLKDIHVSGHGAQEDQKRMLKLVKPKHVIPMHAEPHKLKLFARNAQKWFGYGKDRVHIIKNGDHLVVRGKEAKLLAGKGRVNRRQ
ncbi:MBL fold metallo-hydrolase, partial [Candidatus Woesearchaeota archaeon]|nr:MBL fold metallo-hydrolase [Candidatus Woesearchaeota archaeon]